MCIDWDKHDIELQGLEFDQKQKRLEIIFLPCNHRLTPFGGDDDRIDDDCVADLNEQIKYLTVLNMIVYYN